MAQTSKKPLNTMDSLRHWMMFRRRYRHLVRGALMFVFLTACTAGPAVILKERQAADFAISIPARWVESDVAEPQRFQAWMNANKELIAGWDPEHARQFFASAVPFFAEDPGAPATVGVNKLPYGFNDYVTDIENNPQTRDRARRGITLASRPAEEYTWTLPLSTPAGQRVTLAITDYYVRSPWNTGYVLHFTTLADQRRAYAALFERVAGSFRWTEPERFALRGFSIRPPSGDGWFVAERASHRVEFRKMSRQQAQYREPHSIYAAASTLDAPAPAFATSADFVAAMKKRFELAPGSSRHRNAEASVEFVASPAPRCVRYRVVVEDHEVPGFVGSVFVMSTAGLSCLHPDAPGVLIDVTYSQRHLRGRQPLALEAEVAPFLDSVTFTAAEPAHSPLSAPPGVKFEGPRGVPGTPGPSRNWFLLDPLDPACLKIGNRPDYCPRE